MKEIHFSIKNLSKNYGSISAIKNFDIDIYTGEILGLIGDNGAGKSTLIKILSGVQVPSSGSIFSGGKKIDISSPRKAMEFGIETIYQYTAMAPELSIARNVFIGREKLKWGVRGMGFLDLNTMREVSKKIISDVGLHIDSIDMPIKNLSGGQRQGVAIARAMYFHSKMLILDEPTNHLSVKETNRVLEYVQALKAKGITVIFISHNLHHVHEVSDRVVAMARGTKVKDSRNKDTNINEMIEAIT